jgi:outer membrane protein OmpA-like peptidoglycan-associated protein
MRGAKVGVTGFQQRCGNCAGGGGTVRMRCHPIRWLWGLIPVAMLAWLAMHLESAPMERDLEQRSGAALSAAGHDWASIAFAGRDGLLVGHAASEDQRDEAAALVRNVWGVRVVEIRVALSPPAAPPSTPTPAREPASKLRFPDASAAREVAAHAPLRDVAPTAIAVAHGEIRGSADHPPESTVHARDDVERTALPVATPTVPQAADAQPPASVPAQPAVAATAPLPEHKPAQAETVSPAIAADVPEVPAHKPAVAAAPPESVMAASPTPPVPEVKPEPVPVPPAAATTPLPEPQKPAPSASAAADVEQPSQPEPVAPPLPQRQPRFETAALPPSNIGPEADCVAGVRSAAAPVEVHFAHGQAKLDTRGKTLIDRLIGALNTCPEAALNVAGHSDASGHVRRNLALSKRRARTVTSYMVHKGIDAGRLVAIGYGDQRPVAPNDTQANRAKNRRIEVAITARAAPLPPLPVRKQGTEHGLSRR